MRFDDWTAIDPHGYYLRRLSMSEHAGTHLSAPASFHPGGRTVDEYEARDLIHPAVVIDVRRPCHESRDYAPTLDDLREWESRHGEVPPDSLALLLTGWPERWHDPVDYLGTDDAGTLHFPGFGPEAAAEFLVRERRVSGLGTDTAGVEPGLDSTFAVSRMALAQNLVVLQNLTSLDSLPPTGAVLVIGLLKLEGGSGSPAAVTGFFPSPEGEG